MLLNLHFRGGLFCGSKEEKLSITSKDFWATDISNISRYLSSKQCGQHVDQAGLVVLYHCLQSTCQSGLKFS